LTRISYFTESESEEKKKRIGTSLEENSQQKNVAQVKLVWWNTRETN